MELKRLDDLKHGEITEFVQVYVNKKPEIFCIKLKNEGMKAYEELDKFMGDLNLEGLNCSYFAIGKAAKERDGRIKIWNFANSPKPINREHLDKYCSERGIEYF